MQNNNNIQLPPNVLCFFQVCCGLLNLIIVNVLFYKMDKTQHARGESYWSVRRKIRQHVAAATEMHVDVSADLADDVLSVPECQNFSCDNSGPEETVTEVIGETSQCGMMCDDAECTFECESCPDILTEQMSDVSSVFSSDYDDDDFANANEAIKSFLTSWIAEFNISLTAVTALLRFLQKYHPDLPRDARTLLSTLRTHDIRPLVTGGELWYCGIAHGIKQIHQEGKLNTDERIISLQFNVDGLPLFRSSCLQLWPILCKLVGLNIDPFVVAVYCGSSKPADLADYLKEFVNECTDLLLHGIVIDGSTFQIKVHSFVCDAPARSFLKGIKSHNAYSGCERCHVVGQYVNNRMLFLDIDAQPRTDDSFKSMVDEEHHLQLSPLAQLPIGMVSQFVLDPMHLLYLRVMRRLLYCWLKGSRCSSEISERLTCIRKYIPCEFARRTPSVAELDRWKATEFRLFLLYCGVVVLKDKLCDKLYNNFLLLFVACRILSSSELVCESMCRYVESLLRLFVQDIHKLYGQDSIVYNMHNLIHVVSDVQNYGPLHMISAFPFENQLKKLKRLVRKPHLSLQQIARRLSESSCSVCRAEAETCQPVFKRLHTHGPLTAEYESMEQFACISFPSFAFSLQSANNSALTVLNEPVIICNILRTSSDTAIFLCKKFCTVESFFSYPVVSTQIKVYKVKGIKSDIVPLSVEDIQCKCVRLPTFDHQQCEAFVMIPLLHQ